MKQKKPNLNPKLFWPFCLIIFLIIIFALFLRLLWLDRVPTAVVGDELDYIFNAKAIFLSGKDVSGKWSPFSLSTPPGQIPQAELPALLISPFIGPLKFSLFSARLPYTILGIVYIIFLFLIAQNFFGNKIALLVAIVAAINPWSIYFSRTTFDIPMAGTFYLIALFFLISAKGWKLLLSLPAFFLAFFSYIGTKIIFIPLVLVTCFYSWLVINKKKFTKQYLVVVLLALLIFGWFLFNLKRLPVSSRMNELLTPFGSIVSQTVDTERRLSMTTPLTLVFSNKVVVWGKLFLEKYLGIFSADFFFLHGEARSTYSLWFHGMFYYLDFLFLIIGFVFLFGKDRRLWLFLIALILLAPIPSAMTTMGVEYSLRAILIYPIFTLLIGLGIWAVFGFAKSRSYRWGIATVIFALYFIQLLNFLNIYFFRNPIYNSESFGFSKRVLFRYVDLISPTVDKIYITGANLGYLEGYLFYAGNFDREALSRLRTLIDKGEYSWKNIYFSVDCPKVTDYNANEVIILPADSKCLTPKSSLHWFSIAQLSDGGEVFRIFNDPLCGQFDLNRYPWGIKISDFEVEKLSPKDFCQKFITNLVSDLNY